MSSFGDNFKREDGEDGLEYDDSAFYYFSMSLLTCLVVPMTLLLLKDLVYGPVDLGEDCNNCKCTGCITTMVNKKIEVKRNMFTPNFYFKLGCLALLWCLSIKNFEVVSKIETL